MSKEHIDYLLHWLYIVTDEKDTKKLEGQNKKRMDRKATADLFRKQYVMTQIRAPQKKGLLFQKWTD